MRHHLDTFSAHLTLERQASPCTISAYLSDVRQYLQFIDSHQIPWDSTESANTYLINLQGSNATLWRKRAAIGEFFRFLWQEGALQHDLSIKLHRPPPPVALPKALATSEINQLLQLAAADTTLTGVRKHAFIALTYTSALRVSECAKIRLSDISENNKILIQGKGDKYRWAFLSSDTSHTLQQYLAIRAHWAHKNNPYLWGYGMHKHLLRQTVHKWLQSLGGQIGIEVTPHTLRHTQATQMLPYLNIMDLAKILGHADVNVTSRYLRVRPADLAQKIKAKHPLGKHQQEEQDICDIRVSIDSSNQSNQA